MSALKQSALLFCLAASLGALNSQASAASSAHGHRHAHGEAEVELALDSSGRLSGRLQGAMDGFLPFEHAPKTEAQRQQVRELQQKLTRVDWILTVNPDAQCVQESVRAESSIFQGQDQSGHASLTVNFSLVCARPAQLQSLTFGVLGHSKRLKKIELEFVGPKGQAKAVLNTRKNQFILP